MTDPRRALPSVSALLESDAVQALLERAPRSLLVNAVRETVEAVRRAPTRSPRGDADWARAIGETLDRTARPSLRALLNGTGVVLHTNLGRAPLAAAALDAIATVAAGFSNLEYDLGTGARGSRYVHCAGLLRELTGAEDAVVVNNNAAALVLVLNTIADGREAILSRGELVEIGGSFRVPDIIVKSGVRLVEVGTTNRTHLDDYRSAMTSDSAALLKVHRSNFAVEGYVADVPVSALAALGEPRGVPVVHDLGSGLLLSLEAFGLSGEPTARDALAAGASLVTMSGDKLLGGPQAGIIVGRRELLAAIRRNPLARSYRVDKLTLAALEATLALYREPERAVREVPALAMLTAPVAELRRRATAIAATLTGSVEVVDSVASVGGGAFPTARIPSVALAIGGDAVAVERRLRAGDPPVIARVMEGRTLVDLRGIPERLDVLLARAIGAATA